MPHLATDSASETAMAGMETLRRQRDFDRVFRSGRWRRLPAVAVGVYRRDDGEPTRVAFVAGRRIGKAVRRNRERRRLREAWRLVAEQVRPGLDIVLVARERTAETQFARLQAQLYEVLSSEGLLESAGDER